MLNKRFFVCRFVACGQNRQPYCRENPYCRCAANGKTLYCVIHLLFFPKFKRDNFTGQKSLVYNYRGLVFFVIAYGFAVHIKHNFTPFGKN